MLNNKFAKHLKRFKVEVKGVASFEELLEVIDRNEAFFYHREIDLVAKYLTNKDLEFLTSLCVIKNPNINKEGSKITRLKRIYKLIEFRKGSIKKNDDSLALFRFVETTSKQRPREKFVFAV